MEAWRGKLKHIDVKDFADRVPASYRVVEAPQPVRDANLSLFYCMKEFLGDWSMPMKASKLRNRQGNLVMVNTREEQCEKLRSGLLAHLRCYNCHGGSVAGVKSRRERARRAQPFQKVSARGLSSGEAIRARISFLHPSSIRLRGMSHEATVSLDGQWMEGNCRPRLHLAKTLRSPCFLSGTWTWCGTA